MDDEQEFVDNVGVRAVLNRSHQAKSESRARRRLEAQSAGRGLELAEYRDKVTDKEAKTLFNLCKTGKIGQTELKRLSKAFTERTFSEQFLREDGCLHSLVGLMSGSEENKQMLALYCLANLASKDYRTLHIARSAGPYLMTIISGSNTQLIELAGSVLINLTQSSDQQVFRVLVNQEIVPNLIQLTQQQADNIKEVSYQILYHLLKECTELEGETLSSVCQVAVSSIQARNCPIHLLWVIFALSANQMIHSCLIGEELLQTLLQIATYEIFQKCDSRPLVKVLTPIVRTLGNLCAGPESVNAALYLVRHPDTPAIITSLLSTNYLSLSQETVWLVANIVNQENVLVQEEFVEMDLMDKLEGPAVSAVTRLDPFSANR